MAFRNVSVLSFSTGLIAGFLIWMPIPGASFCIVLQNRSTTGLSLLVKMIAHFSRFTGVSAGLVDAARLQSLLVSRSN